MDRLTFAGLAAPDDHSTREHSQHEYSRKRRQKVDGEHFLDPDILDAEVPEDDVEDRLVQL